DGATGGRAGGERVVEVDAGQVQAQRVDGGEPADGAGQVGAGGGGAVAAVPFEVAQQRGRVVAAVAATRSHRQGEGGEQAVVDGVGEGVGHGGEQRLGDRGGQFGGDGGDGGVGVAHRIERPVPERRVRSVEHSAPEVE